MDRLERRSDDHETRIRRNEQRMVKIDGALERLTAGQESCSEDTRAIRKWVEAQLRKADEQAERQEEEDRRISTAWKLAIFAACGSLVVGLIAAIASLVSAGVFG